MAGSQVLRDFLWALAMGRFDSGGVCSMGLLWYMIYSWKVLGSGLGAYTRGPYDLLWMLAGMPSRSPNPPDGRSFCRRKSWATHNLLGLAISFVLFFVWPS